MSEEQVGSDPRVIHALREGQYTLLLGAGASHGATSRNGQPLPTGKTFAKELALDLSLDVAPNTPLAYVWDAAVQKSGSEQALRTKFCISRFLNCHPALHHLLLPTFAWKRIYTFNIDDVVPASYKMAPSALQKPIPIHFDDDRSDTYPDPTADECQIVYLHGAELFPSRPLVFGSPDYASAVTRQHTWWHVFASAFVCDPFIVIGASLREPDFETYLAWKQRLPLPLALPSFYVSPELDDAVRATCTRLGLIPIQMSGADFLKRLDTAVDKRDRISVRRARSVQHLSLLSTIKAVPILATLARQFIVVNDRDSWPSEGRAAEDFLEGHSPLWEDIQHDRDVQLSIEVEIVARARKFFAPETSTKRIAVLCVEGTAGSGKTTALMRAATGISDLGIDTLFFVGHDGLRSDVLADVAGGLSPNAGFVVVIDDINGHINQVRRLIEIYPSPAGQCFLLCAVRAGHRHFVEQNLSDLLEPQFLPIAPLAQTEALRLAEKLRSAAKLGRFLGKTSAELADQFVSTRPTGWAGQLLTILMQVVPGGTFRERLASEWKSLPDNDVRTFYGTICIASACGIPIRSPVAFRALQTPETRYIFSEVTMGSMRGLVEWFDQEFVRPRHRVVAEEIIRRCMDRAELFHISSRLAAALSPYVNRRTIITRSPEARLARELMDTDGLVVPALGSRAEEWFKAVEREWGWNSRYWEQRALTAMKAKHYSRARDFAEQGVGAETPPHPMPMTTCALVKLSSVEHDVNLTRSNCEDLFSQAIDLLDEAIDAWYSRRSFADEHPYHVLFQHSVRVALKLTGGIPEKLRIKLERHGATAEKLFKRDRAMVRILSELKDHGIDWRQ